MAGTQGITKSSGHAGGVSLKDVYLKLYERFGPQKWWPADSRFEVIIGAILTQSAAWTNVEKAIASLK
ncbi:MAG: endonuclease III domain-containing protein, partial [Dehalococcoidia bacterium]